MQVNILLIRLYSYFSNKQHMEITLSVLLINENHENNIFISFKEALIAININSHACDVGR